MAALLRQLIEIVIYGTHTPFFLQKYFDAIWPGKVDVLNLGILGGQVNDNLRAMEYYFSLNPDMVIIAPVWNDAHSLTQEKFILNRKFLRNISCYDVQRYIQGKQFFARYALGYYLYKLFSARVTKIQTDVCTGSAIDIIMNSKDKYWDVYEKRLDILTEMFIKKGVKVVLVTLPSLSTGIEPTPVEKEIIFQEYKKLGWEYDKKGLFELVRLMDYLHLIDEDVITRVADKRKITVIECEEDSVFKDATYSVKKDFFGDHCHCNAMGTELIGRIIVGKIYKIVKDDL